jgi:hypothetical protein
MSQTAIPQSVVSRVQKLLAMANDKRGNENETTVAMIKAQDILAEYNLTIAQIGVASDAPETVRGKKATKFAAANDWQVLLMSAVAQGNFCMSWIDIVQEGSQKFKRHMLLGRQVNVVVAEEMYQYLNDSMHRLLKSDLPEFYSVGSKFGQSWLKGCTSRIVSRLREQRKRAEAEKRARDGEPNRGNGSDLTLADVYSTEDDLNWDFLYGFTPGTTSANRRAREAELNAMKTAQDMQRAEKMIDETPAQKRKREADSARYEAKWRKRYEREQNKMDHDAYRLGAEKGREIGLETQVTGESPVNRLN